MFVNSNPNIHYKYVHFDMIKYVHFLPKLYTFYFIDLSIRVSFACTSHSDFEKTSFALALMETRTITANHSVGLKSRREHPYALIRIIR